MENKKALAPCYYKEFECIGSDCDDTCCQKWDINIDKDTYDMYRKIEDRNKTAKNKKFSPLSTGMIKRNKNADSEFNYAKFILNEDKKCVFLCEDLLCGIYKNMGYHYMPYTCKIYPRVINYIIIDDEVFYEQSMSLSCTEVARKALLNKSMMEFEYIDKEDFKGITNIVKNTRPEHKYFFDIRMAGISILQSRKYSIVHRLMLLGMMYKRLQVCIDEQRYDDIPSEIEKFMNIVELSDDSIFENISANDEVQRNIKRTIIENISGINRDDIEKNMLTSIVLLSVDRYYHDDNKKLEYDKFVSEHDYIFENYLVNNYFLYLMPFGKYDSMWDSLIYLCSEYAYIKIVLMGHIFRHNETTIDDFVKIIYTISRLTSHSKPYIAFILSKIKEWELDTLGGLYNIIC